MNNIFYNLFYKMKPAVRRGVIVKASKPVPFPKVYEVNFQGSLPYFLIIGASFLGGGVVAKLFIDRELAVAVLAFMRGGL